MALPLQPPSQRVAGPDGRGPVVPLLLMQAAEMVAAEVAAAEVAAAEMIAAEVAAEVVVDARSPPPPVRPAAVAAQCRLKCLACGIQVQRDCHPQGCLGCAFPGQRGCHEPWCRMEHWPPGCFYPQQRAAQPVRTACMAVCLVLFHTLAAAAASPGATLLPLASLSDSAYTVEASRTPSSAPNTAASVSVLCVACVQCHYTSLRTCAEDEAVERLAIWKAQHVGDMAGTQHCSVGVQFPQQAGTALYGVCVGGCIGAFDLPRPRCCPQALQGCWRPRCRA